MIYLDNAATTMVKKEVLNAMLPYFGLKFGNPGSLYALGREAKDAVENARKEVASFFGCDAENILFTSGGSEGNNFALKAAVRALKSMGRNHIVVSAIEHDSVLRAADALIKQGFHISYVKPYRGGSIPSKAVKDAITTSTGLVSVMYANNETGAVNNIAEIGKICKENNVLFHTDCVQAAGNYPLEVATKCADFATISGHKIGAPKGIGAIYVKNKAFMLDPLIDGGRAQEFGLRGGTENVPYIVGLGEACRLVSDTKDARNYYAEFLKPAFFKGLGEGIIFAKNSVPDCGPFEFEVFNGHWADSKVISICFPGVDNESLLLGLDRTFGVCVSAGSACTAHETKPSHVLTAMGISEERARSTIRVSFCMDTTEDEAYHGGFYIGYFARFLKNGTPKLNEEIVK